MEALSRNLDYFWCGIIPNNNQPIMHGFSVKVCWKPVLIYTKGKAKPERIFCDNFALRTATKSWQTSQALHKWGQAESVFFEPIDAFCPENGILLDPFLGGGTTLRAAKDVKRRSVGIEIDEKCCEIAAERMRQGILF